MVYITQPANSQVRLSPYSQRLLHYGVDDSRIYLSKATNSLLNPFIMGYYGDRLPSKTEFSYNKLRYNDRLDCIIDGLENEFLIENDIITCTISPGQCIVDQTLLIFPEETTLDVELKSITFTGTTARCVLSINFQWLESLYEQPPRLRLLLIDPNDPLSYGPDAWETQSDRLVISYFDIDLTDHSKSINVNPKPTLNYHFDYINIKNIPYEVGPNIIFLANAVKYIDSNYAKKRIFFTPPVVDPEGLTENQITFPINFFNDELNPHSIIGVSFDIKYDPNELKSPIYSPSTALSLINKLTDVYVDLDSNSIETGRLRIQVGQNALSPIVLKTMKFGDVTFFFNSNAPSGTNVNITVENVVATYSNATTSLLQYVPRQPETNGLNLQAPALTYNFQPSQINFGNVNLSIDMFLNFDINEVRERIPVTAEMIAEIVADGSHLINSDLRCHFNSDNDLILTALNSNIIFTDPIITNADLTHQTLEFQEVASSGEVNFWQVLNPNWYWTPTQYDMISVTLNNATVQTHVLSDQDITHMMNNPDIWVTIPSMTEKYLQVKYSFISGQNIIQFRLAPDYISMYDLSAVKYTMKSGSSICSKYPGVIDFKRAQHVYDLNEIQLNPGDYIKYKDNITNTDETINITNDVLAVLKGTKVGYKEKNIHMYITNTNMLILDSIIYNTQFEYSNIYDLYVDLHEPLERPCLWFYDNFTSTRPTGDSSFVPELNKLYTSDWKVGHLVQSAGERDFYCLVDISDFNSTDVFIQVYQNNFVIHPQSIEILPDEKQVKIWMPEEFVFADPLPELKIFVVG